MLSSHNFIAVGEIGIDLYWDQSNLEYQKFALKHKLIMQKNSIYQLLSILEIHLKKLLK